MAIEVDLDFFRRLLDLDAPSDPFVRHGVAIGVDGHIPMDVDDALVELIGLRDPFGQRLEMWPLRGIELDGAGLEMTFVGAILFFAPLPRLGIEIVPVGKGPASKEIILDVVKGTLDASRAVGVANGVSTKEKAITLAKGLHFGHGYHQ